MTQRKGHMGKSKMERDYYSRFIKNLDYEPTIDETIKFPETDDTKRDFSLPKSSDKRKVSLKQKLSDHFEENWIRWVIGAFVVLLIFLMYDSKVDIKGIETNVDNIKEDMKDVKGSQKEIQNKLHEQDLKIQENKIKLESIESRPNK